MLCVSDETLAFQAKRNVYFLKGFSAGWSRTKNVYAWVPRVPIGVPHRVLSIWLSRGFQAEKPRPKLVDTPCMRVISRWSTSLKSLTNQ